MRPHPIFSARTRFCSMDSHGSHGCEPGVGLQHVSRACLRHNTLMSWDCEDASYACLFELSSVYSAVRGACEPLRLGQCVAHDGAPTERLQDAFSIALGETCEKMAILGLLLQFARVASQLLRVGSPGHGASRRVRSERAASRTARAEPSRRLCNGYNSPSAPSSAEASKIRVLKDYAQCTQMGLGAHPFGLGRRSWTPTNQPPPAHGTARTWESS